jgi:hypothetical protein
MTDEPLANAVTTPVLLTVATDALPLLQEPPVGEHVNVELAPTGIAALPEIAPTVAAGLTVIGKLSDRLPQALLVVVYLIVAAPGNTPVTSPAGETVAAVPEDRLQVPPPDAAVKLTGAPMQTLEGPEIRGSPGAGKTVIAFIARTDAHALATVYTTVSSPADIPVITPVGVTEARLVLLMLQTPPPVGSVIVNMLPGHTATVPPIGPTDGIGPTVTTQVANAAPTV